MAANEERVLHTIATTKRNDGELKVSSSVTFRFFDAMCLNTHLWFLELIEERKCANNEEIVRERITKLQTQWERLTKQSQSKSRYLKESNQLQQYSNNVKELDYWLSEVSLKILVVVLCVMLCCVVLCCVVYVVLCCGIWCMCVVLYSLSLSCAIHQLISRAFDLVPSSVIPRNFHSSSFPAWSFSVFLLVSFLLSVPL